MEESNNHMDVGNVLASPIPLYSPLLISSLQYEVLPDSPPTMHKLINYHKDFRTMQLYRLIFIQF